MLLHSALGFGAALIAMPLLAVLVPLQTATPLVALVMLTTVSVLLWRAWGAVEFRSTARLLVATAAGLPVGLYALRAAPEALVRGALAVVLVAYGLYGLTRPRFAPVRSRAWDYGLGFVAGILGGAYNTNGPPIVLYGALRRWPPERFRATLQSYFVPTTVLICTGHAATGLWTREVLGLYAVSVPFVLVAIAAGLRIGRAIPPRRFDTALHVALLGLGCVLLLGS